ncbi:MAG: hypothetical protein LUG65_01990 [Clostridiales bacterium]|nr:hypothetical protein [Clostridiales bacterium]
MQNTFNYEIVEHIATLSESGNTSKELNRVSYNGSPAKYDLRSWKRDDGEEKLLKGLTLTAEEAQALKDALNAIEVA